MGVIGYFLELYIQVLLWYSEHGTLQLSKKSRIQTIEYIKRHCESKVSLAQEHNTMSMVRAQTWTARYRDKHANYAGTAPPMLSIIIGD